MERTDKQKEQLLKDLWYSRNPCHDKDQEGNDRFWGTALCVFNDYQKALTIPFVVRMLVCVDDVLPNLTEGKEYEMLTETNRHYNLIDDNGNDVLIGKSYMRELKKAN